MSMLSWQCDVLRVCARNLRTIAGPPSAAWQAANEMDKAADTIWRLRNDCVELRDKNDQLQEKLADLWPRAAFTMSRPCKEQWIEDLRELGVEVEDDEHSEY